MKFLKLTEQLSNGGTETIILNASQMASIKLSERGRDTHICMAGGLKYFFVKESIEDIWKMLDDSAAPIQTPKALDLRERFVT